MQEFFCQLAFCFPRYDVNDGPWLILVFDTFQGQLVQYSFKAIVPYSSNCSDGHAILSFPQRLLCNGVHRIEYVNLAVGRDQLDSSRSKRSRDTRMGELTE